MRITIVDDHRVVADGLKTLFPDNAQCVGCFTCAETFLTELTHGFACDVAIVDLKMPGMGGVELCRRLKRHFPSIKIMVVSSEARPPVTGWLLDMGVEAVLDKAIDPVEFSAALAQVKRGKRYLSQSVAQAEVLGDQTPELTPREYQIVTGLLNGTPAKELADQLFLSPKTVSTYKQRAMDKLGVCNDLELVMQAVDLGWVTRLQPS